MKLCRHSFILKMKYMVNAFIYYLINFLIHCHYQIAYTPLCSRRISHQGHETKASRAAREKNYTPSSDKTYNY